ncbi:MAG: ATP-binding cassette domain-containing protein [Chloroflexi bacterium]|nr:ATP-binding cassette domain-containing protein [Chloroflexota bacterium]MQC26984.1 ATP-binding cassette domain-containing protein [Chloroflexota bacterium]
MRVELNNIRKSFGSVHANDGISMTLESGRVYGLLGQNGAGKSTLMKILAGYQSADSGEIRLNETLTQFDSPAAALRAGIGMLYQDPLDFPPFSVLENFQLGRREGIFLDQKTASRELLALGKRYNFDVDLDERISNLSPGERQQLELIRLLAGGANVLILDEPTTGISSEQKQQLFDSIRKLAREENKTVILVSHKLSEVQELCDHVFVLREGQLAGKSEIPCPMDKLVKLMFAKMPPRSKRPAYKFGQAVLDVRDLHVETYRLRTENLNFSVRAGEVLGLAGLEGSGQDLLIKALAGLLTPKSGEVLLRGEDITRRPFHQRQRAGIAYVASGRLEEGLIADLSLVEHMVLSTEKPGFLVNWERAGEATQDRIAKYQVVGQPASRAKQLSGGNQQRFLFAMLKPALKLILMEHPTRGLDIRSANWIWDLLNKRRDEDTAIIFYSADLDEVIERSDRIAAFSGGVMSRMVNAAETSVDELGHLIGGQQ